MYSHISKIKVTLKKAGFLVHGKSCCYFIIKSGRKQNPSDIQFPLTHAFHFVLFQSVKFNHSPKGFGFFSVLEFYLGTKKLVGFVFLPNRKMFNWMDSVDFGRRMENWWMENFLFGILIWGKQVGRVFLDILIARIVWICYLHCLCRNISYFSRSPQFFLQVNQNENDSIMISLKHPRIYLPSFFRHWHKFQRQRKR